MKGIRLIDVLYNEFALLWYSLSQVRGITVLH